MEVAPLFTLLSVYTVYTVVMVYTVDMWTCGLRRLRGLTGLILLLYIYCHMVRTPLGKGYMAFWGFRAKCRTG